MKLSICLLSLLGLGLSQIANATTYSYSLSPRKTIAAGTNPNNIYVNPNSMNYIYYGTESYESLNITFPEDPTILSILQNVNVENIESIGLTCTSPATEYVNGAFTGYTYNIGAGQPCQIINIQALAAEASSVPATPTNISGQTVLVGVGTDVEYNLFPYNSVSPVDGGLFGVNVSASGSSANFYYWYSHKAPGGSVTTLEEFKFNYTPGSAQGMFNLLIKTPANLVTNFLLFCTTPVATTSTSTEITNVYPASCALLDVSGTLQ